jgi:asparagine synthase (glutamine-hydrolysing)
MLAARMPRALFERPKMGFAVPLGGWLRNELRDWAGDLIAATDWRGLGIAPEPVRDAWRRHQSASEDHADRLWTIVMLADWHRRETELPSGRAGPG